MASINSQCSSRMLLELLQSNDLKQTVEKLTRREALLTSVLRPHFTADGFKSEVTERIMDHRAVLVCIPLPIQKPHISYISFPNLKRVDDASFIGTLCKNFDNFVQLSAGNDVDARVAFFESLLLSCILRFMPVKTKKKKPV